MASLRQVSGTWQPRCQVIPLNSLRERLEKKLKHELPVPPKLYLEVLQRLGFVPPENELYEKLLNFYSSQVLGFYEPEGDTMVIVRRSHPETAESNEVWLHEFAHAAQEKRFRLPSKLLAVKDNSDLQRAFSAIAEGEAMLVMVTLASSTPLEPAAILHLAQAVEAGTKQLAQEAGVGEFFVQDLAFPYARGLTKVFEAFQKQGWPGVDAILINPPKCTAALLFTNPCHHLENSVLPTNPPGYEPLITDTLGAWAIQFWLSQTLGEEAATSLAHLWDGDRLRILRNQKEPRRWAMVWQLRLRTAEALPQAETALRRHTSKALARFQLGSQPDILVRSQNRMITVLVDWPAARP